MLDAGQEKAEAVIQGPSRSAPDQGSHRNRGCLPGHLPRVERIIEPASTLCPCGCGAMTKIGEDVSKRLDVIPAQWRVLITRRRSEHEGCTAERVEAKHLLHLRRKSIVATAEVDRPRRVVHLQT